MLLSNNGLDGMDKAEVAAAYQLVRKHRKEWLQSITEQYEKTAEAQNKKKGRLYKSIEEDVS